MVGIQPVDKLTGLNKDELDQLLLSDEEEQIKEQVWVEMDREYLKAIAGKCVTVPAIWSDLKMQSIAEQPKGSNASQVQHRPSTRRFVPHFMPPKFLAN